GDGAVAGDDPVDGAGALTGSVQRQVVLIEVQVGRDNRQPAGSGRVKRLRGAKLDGAKADRVPTDRIGRIVRESGAELDRVAVDLVAGGGIVKGNRVDRHRRAGAEVVGAVL